MEDKFLFIAIFSGVWCLIGAVFMMVSWIIASVVADKKKTCTSKAFGTVIDLVRNTSEYGRGNTARGFHPVVQYTTAKGETLTVTSPINNSPPKYRVGENVHIRYSPEKPEKFYIEGDNTAEILKKVFLFVGLGCCAIGLITGILVWALA